MIDLKRQPEKTEKADKAPVALEIDRYPYGTRLSFESEEIKKIPFLASVNVNDVVKITAVGKICSVSSHEVEGKDETSKRVEIQIQAIEFAKDENEITLEQAIEHARIKGSEQAKNAKTAMHPFLAAKRAGI